MSTAEIIVKKTFGIARFTIHPGKAADFRAHAEACLRAAEVDLTGTQAYEWFATPDGAQCVVIEIYDGADAMAHHGRHVGRTIPALLAHASSRVTLLGDVPADVMERMSGRISGLEYFGDRFQGKLVAPAPGRKESDGGGKIFAIAHFAIAPGRLDEFRALAAQCRAAVLANEPGTLAYEWFLDPAGQRCVTLDIYRDMDALRTHIANVGPIMAKILAIVTSEVELLGAIAPDMVAQLKSDLGVRYVAAQHQGIL